MSVTVYTKANCPQCTATINTLTKKGAAFDVVDLEKDADAMALVSGFGIRALPIVVAGETKWGGFRPDMLSAHVA